MLHEITHMYMFRKAFWILVWVILVTTWSLKTNRLVDKDEIKLIFQFKELKISDLAEARVQIYTFKVPRAEQ